MNALRRHYEERGLMHVPLVLTDEEKVAWLKKFADGHYHERRFKIGDVVRDKRDGEPCVVVDTHPGETWSQGDTRVAKVTTSPYTDKTSARFCLVLEEFLEA